MTAPACLDVAGPHAAAEHVRYALIDGRVVLLDLRVGNYIMLDELASHLWCAITGAHGDTQGPALAGTLGLTDAECDREVRDFVEGCRSRGLLADADRMKELGPSSLLGAAQRARRPSAFQAWRCLVWTRYELARSGFSSVYRRARAHHRCAGAEPPPPLEPAVRSFRRAENFLPIVNAPIDCLPRSLSLHMFLRSVGIDAVHLIGVRRFPFQAHAWVQVGEDVVCDSRAFVSQFTEISRA